MARRRTSEADRLHRHNEEMKLALRENITVLAARQRLAQLRMVELEERVHPPLKPAIGLCGTSAPELPTPDAKAFAAKPRFWWQD